MGSIRLTECAFRMRSPSTKAYLAIACPPRSLRADLHEQGGTLVSVSLRWLRRRVCGFIVQETARIARTHVLIFDYGRDGGWFIRFIEWIEGPNYPVFVAEDRERELGKAGLRIDREERVTDFGSCWLCTPSSRRSASSAQGAREEFAAPE
jgi:hypothetical protein